MAMTLVGSDQDVSLTGDAFAGALGLKSDWFTTNAPWAAPAVGMAATPRGPVTGWPAATAAWPPSATPDSWGGQRPRPRPAGGGHGRHARRQGLLAGGLRRRALQLRKRRLLRLDGRDSPQPAGGGHGRHPRRQGLLGGGLRRWHLLLRRRRLLRLDGRDPLNQPVVGMAATPDGKGYWEVASDGGIFSFGDAALLRLDGRDSPQPAGGGHGRHPRRQGYWQVASDGGIFSFGDAAFYGSTVDITLAEPVVGMAADPGRRATGWSPPTAASSPSETPPSGLGRRVAAPPHRPHRPDPGAGGGHVLVFRPR